jgi:hypothetical protein
MERGGRDAAPILKETLMFMQIKKGYLGCCTECGTEIWENENGATLFCKFAEPIPARNGMPEFKGIRVCFCKECAEERLAEQPDVFSKV